jgi:hypothetical protein
MHDETVKNKLLFVQNKLYNKCCLKSTLFLTSIKIYSMTLPNIKQELI